VRYFNHRYRQSGALWEGCYRSCLVQDERYLLECHRYIELNPVRAGMVDDPAHYRWSSYRDNGLGRNGCYLTLAMSIRVWADYGYSPNMCRFW
jgi:putative transposase